MAFFTIVGDMGAMVKKNNLVGPITNSTNPGRRRGRRHCHVRHKF